MSEISKKITLITLNYFEMGYIDFELQREGDTNFLKKDGKKVTLNISDTKNLDSFLDNCLQNLKTTD